MDGVWALAGFVEHSRHNNSSVNSHSNKCRASQHWVSLVCVNGFQVCEATVASIPGPVASAHKQSCSFMLLSYMIVIIFSVCRNGNKIWEALDLCHNGQI